MDPCSHHQNPDSYFNCAHYGIARNSSEGELNEDKLNEHELKALMDSIVQNTHKKCYNQDEMYDSIKIYERYFRVNLEAFQGDATDIVDVVTVDNEPVRMQRSVFWRDIALIYMFSRFSRHFDIYKPFLDRNLEYMHFSKSTSQTERFNPLVLYYTFQDVHVVNVRGSTTIGDWLTNISTTYDITIPENLTTYIQLSDLSKLSSNSHNGFLQHSLNALSLIVHKLVQQPIRTVVIYGHSLGAACASLLGLLMSKYLNLQVYINVIACPQLILEPYVSETTDLNYVHYYSYRDFAVNLPGFVLALDSKAKQLVGFT